VQATVGDREQPVVLFALEWCEFCWSLRKMLARLGVSYRSVDLDSVPYQSDDRGGKIRAALTARTSVSTIPQVFVGGEFIGGCTDVFDAYKAGRLQGLFDKFAVAYDRSLQVDPYSFLPSWLHPR
jgi:cysteine synthase A